MNPLFCLEDILSYFRPLFNQQNFALFQAIVCGFIANTHGGTLTRLYQSSFSKTQYWSFTKFLSRGVWDVDAFAARLIEKIQAVFPYWVYVYDLTSALKTGKNSMVYISFATSGIKRGVSINQSFTSGMSSLP